MAVLRSSCRSPLNVVSTWMPLSARRVHWFEALATPGAGATRTRKFPDNPNHHRPVCASARVVDYSTTNTDGARRQSTQTGALLLRSFDDDGDCGR
jgi:hypothetical protein